MFGTRTSRPLPGLATRQRQTSDITRGMTFLHVGKERRRTKLAHRYQPCRF